MITGWQTIGQWEHEYDANGYTGRYRSVGGMMADGTHPIFDRKQERIDRLAAHALEEYALASAWHPTFYWTGDFEKDAILINKPHIEKQGEKEDRTALTLELLNIQHDFQKFNSWDAQNMQNYLLKDNNWGAVKAGWRENVAAILKPDGTELPVPKPDEVEPLINLIFPVEMGDKDHLLKWYRNWGVIHPFTDLNGRVGGIIVSVLYHNYLKRNA